MDMSTPNRYWQLDSIRGFAVVLMVIYHSLFDLNYFGGPFLGLHFNLNPLLQLVIPVTIGTLFFLVLGASAFIKFQQLQKQSVRPFLLRGILLFAIGLSITLVTAIFVPQGPIYFGVLHSLGLSLVLLFPFLLINRYGFNLLLGMIIIAVGVFLLPRDVHFPWLIWVGFTPEHYQSLDYYPIFPWFGVSLIGLVFGKVFFEHFGAAAKIPTVENFRPRNYLTSLAFLGRHSLLIYLVHQPVIMGLTMAIFRLSNFVRLR